MTNETIKMVSAAVGGLTVGAFVGFKVAEKRLLAQFDERLQKETEEMRTFYTSVGKKKYTTPQEAAAALVPEQAGAALVEYQGEDPVKIAYHKIVKSEVVVEQEPEAETSEPKIEFPTVAQNIFESKRDANKPYIISQEEFMENEPEFEQATLTYYEKGATLADYREDIIEDFDKVIGEDFALSFGTGSSDENSVHVRNEFLKMDFEVIRSENSYEQDVLGVEENPIKNPSARQRRGE